MQKSDKAYLLSFGGRYAFLLSFRWTMLLCSRIFANIQIGRAPKPDYYSILSIYGYYPNVEYRRLSPLVVKYE